MTIISTTMKNEILGEIKVIQNDKVINSVPPLGLDYYKDRDLLYTLLEEYKAKVIAIKTTPFDIELLIPNYNYQISLERMDSMMRRISFCIRKLQEGSYLILTYDKRLKDTCKLLTKEEMRMYMVIHENPEMLDIIDLVKEYIEEYM